MAEPMSFDEATHRLAALGDDVRRGLYRFVVDQGRPVGRDEAAAGVGVPRHTAKFHLDKLVEEGLLESEFRRLSERTGPGAGRPAKLYRRAGREVSVSVPERHYELAGALLADAVAAAVQRDVPVEAALADRTLAAGRAAGEARAAVAPDDGSDGALVDVLRAHGFEPYMDGDDVRLRNCPFHLMAQGQPEIVCAMNLDFCRGLLEGLGHHDLVARLDPGDERCCVAFGREHSPATSRMGTATGG